MKAVILAGGLGTRLAEETGVRPKPMVEIGGRPILWHIMKLYAHHGVTEFIICLGYKGYLIKEYFANYFLHSSDVTFDLAGNRIEVHRKQAEPWLVTLVDTGDQTQTGGRIKRVASYLGDETFCMTYGDGVSDVDVKSLVQWHKRHKRLATVTAVQPPGRFGSLDLKYSRITRFKEKPNGDRGWISGGFFVLEPEVLNRIEGDETVWERGPMEGLAIEGQMTAYQHSGFWHPMDTLRDKMALEAMWERKDAPWRIWGES